MKGSKMAVFLIVVLSVYLAGNTYLFLKGYNAIPAFHDFSTIYFISFTLLALTFVGGKILEARHSGVLSDILNVIGGFWMAFLLYGFIFLFLSDIISIISRLTGILNSGNIVLYKKWAYTGTIILSVILISGGFINAVTPVVRQYDITINKPVDEISEMKIAAVSDIHLGSIIRKRSLKKLSSILTTLKPDLVLLLGDIVDGELGPVIRGDLLKYFSCPDCNRGLYAITGNHEFIGGAGRTIPYIESKGIRILKDETVTLTGGIQLIGRLDRDSGRFYGKERAPLKELMNKIDITKPVILLDHQPVNLKEAEINGIDLQLSGHTHNGQMWPLNHITSRIYELSYGYLKKGNTQYIVSSGYGLWGPRTRSGSRSEVLLINIKFGKP
jgi:predicted MPP superfamily phosphohydrolase